MKVRKTILREVQKHLDNVVGLMKMDWPMFSKHIIHHVEKWRKEKCAVEEQNEQLANKLMQLLLGDDEPILTRLTYVSFQGFFFIALQVTYVTSHLVTKRVL